MNHNKKSTNTSGSVMRYAGMATQMFVMFGIALFVGRYFDQKIGFEKPILGVTLLFISFGAYFYKLYIDLTKHS